MVRTTRLYSMVGIDKPNQALSKYLCVGDVQGWVFVRISQENACTDFDFFKWPTSFEKKDGGRSESCLCTILVEYCSIFTGKLVH